GMETEGLRPGWEALGAEVGQELAAWRAAHPRATLAEIEGVVLEAVERLQARFLEDLAHASAAAEAGAEGGPRPRCPECGGVLEGRGWHARAVLHPAAARAAAAAAALPGLPDLRGGPFPPWTRNWGCCPGG